MIKLIRSDKNPLLSPINTKKHWWEARSVFNPGAIVYNGKIYLLYRALGEVHYSSFGLAVLTDPETVEKRFEKSIYEADENNRYEEFGVEDPRITFLEGRYWIVYTGPSIYHEGEKRVNPWDHMKVPWRIRCSLVSTTDFISFKRHGVIISNIDSKNGVLFPEKINDQYVLLHRIFPDMYISFSDRIDRFDRGKALCIPRMGMWDSERVGAGAVPIKTPLGWLCFYHGVEKKPLIHDRKSMVKEKYIYRLGTMLLGLKDPRKILYRSNEPILEPETPYEKTGYVNNVVFTCGAIEWGERYYIYYGAADSCIGVAHIDKKQLLDYLSKMVNNV